LQNVPITKRADFEEPPFPNANVVPNCQQVIAEWKVARHDADEVDPASYREILRFDRPEFNHNGGTLAFGHDGLLYASIGDGGAANDVGPGHNPTTGNGQDLSTILGKVIRINPLDPRHTRGHHGVLSANGQYRIPGDNPFVGKAGAVKEIYAYGFRNPFRMSFDREDGRLIVADVGQNNIEEVDIVSKGGNFGWHIKEGTFLFDPATGNVFTDPKPNPKLINPVLEYDHFEATAGKITRIAVVGGFVYRGDAIRSLRGKYVFADLNGFLFVGDLGSGRIEQLLNVGFFIKGISQDAAGELYVLGSTLEGPSGSNGSIMRLDPVGGDGRHGGDGDDDGDDD
jgi:glucose/arabinose dehydrogenase